MSSCMGNESNGCKVEDTCTYTHVAATTFTASNARLTLLPLALPFSSPCNHWGDVICDFWCYTKPEGGEATNVMIGGVMFLTSE